MGRSRSRESRSCGLDASSIVTGKGRRGGVDACREGEEEEEQRGLHCAGALV